ncbi:MAG: FtsX-like permease family protein, partial [Acidobacteriota bacterium]
FTFVASPAAALAFGLLPAVRLSRSDVQEVLRASGPGAMVSRGERRMLSGLIVVEVALSVILLVGAGLMLSSFRNVTSVDPGFELDDRLTFSVAPPEASYDLDQAARFVRALERRVAALPGVRAVGSAALVPLVGTGTTGVTLEGQREDEAGDNPGIQFSPVTPGFFEAMGMKVLRGRAFTDADGPDAVPAVVVSAGMAARFWPGEEAVGRRLRITSRDTWMTVIGVVNDVRYGGLTGEVRPQMYLAHAQDPWRGMGLVVHAEGEPTGLMPAVREVIHDLDPTVAPYNVISLSALYDMHSFEWRFSAVLFWIFAAIAALLASIGLYSILAFAVSRRTREIGIRSALGAARGDLVAMVAGQAGRLVALGLGLGLAGAFALSRVLGSQLYDVDPHDPATYLLVAALTGIVAVAATALPARRAARLDPVSALREE